MKEFFNQWVQYFMAAIVILMLPYVWPKFIKDYKAGKVHTRGGYLYKDKNPFLFYANLIFQFLMIPVVVLFLLFMVGNWFGWFS